MIKIVILFLALLFFVAESATVKTDTLKNNIGTGIGLFDNEIKLRDHGDSAWYNFRRGVKKNTYGEQLDDGEIPAYRASDSSLIGSGLDTSDLGDKNTKVVGINGITVTHSNDSAYVGLYQPPNIVTFTNTEALHYAGQTVTSVTTNWTLDGSPITSQTHTDYTAALSDRTHAFTGLSLTSDKTYTLSVTDGISTDVASTYVRFYIASFFGTSTVAAPTEAIVEAGNTVWELQSAANRALPNTSITGAGNYIYYAYPGSWGNVQIVVNGFNSTWIKTTVSITNSYGNTQNYYVYTSPTPIVGTITLSATGI